MQKLARNIVFGSFFAAILIAAAYLAASTSDASRLPIHATMLDIIRCSPPVHPDSWLQRTTMESGLDAREFGLGSLLQRADIFDPNECGRSITQAMGVQFRPLNQEDGA